MEFQQPALVVPTAGSGQSTTVNTAFGADLQVTAAEGTFTVAVSDTGPGIAAADQQKIFEEFHQANGAQKQRGTGLGLAISKKIVDMHGGRMWVESSLGKGSTFWFTLPVWVEQQQEVV